MPRFVGANEVNRRYLGPKSLICGSVSDSESGYVLLSSGKGVRKWRNVRVGSRWGGVVRKAEPVPVSSPPFIEQPLVCSIPRAFLLEQIDNLLELFFSGREHHHSRIENVRPADVWYSRKLVFQSK